MVIGEGNIMNVLIVDDDVEICEFMKNLLEKEGVNVTLSHQPNDALEKIKDGNFHLIILDIMLPGMDGIELLREIRMQDSDVAIAIFTGYPSLESAIEALKLEAIDYIPKPFTPKQVKELIEKVMKKKGLVRDPEQNLYLTIGRNIRELRKKKGLTLKQLSRRTGLSISLLSQIERAESSSSISSLYKIAHALDTTITELFGGL